jgi:hypothetical protein
MKKNRKRAETYRFNGSTYLHTGSIHPVEMGELESLIRTFEAKLADPTDPDDKKWVARWLGRFRKEHDKKLAGFGLKLRDKLNRRRPG